MVKKKEHIIEKVLVADIGTQGKAIARVNNLVTFVSGALPGDVVDIRITRKRKSWQEGRTVYFHSYSDLRTIPFCEHFGVCGGCRWQDLQYASQLKYKQQEVSGALKHIGRIADPPVRPIIASEKTRFYRNKMEFTFSARRWLEISEISGGQPVADHRALGLNVHGLFDRVVDLKNCYLQAEPSNAIRLSVRDYALHNGLGFYDDRMQSGLLRNLIIRTTVAGEVMVIVVLREENERAIKGLLGHLQREFPGINSLIYVINPKANDSMHDLQAHCFSGQNHLTETIDDIPYRIGPKSFFQTNTMQALTMYQLVKEYAQLTGRETVYDLYTGAGTIAIFLASSANKVIGIEYIGEAVSDARQNALANGINNVSFVAGDIKDVMDEAFMSEHGRPEVVITDPPRAGMHPAVVKALLAAAPQRIIYVSCNPATQSRDIALLSERYLLQIAQPIDMFPHTYHVENVAVMERK